MSDDKMYSCCNVMFEWIWIVMLRHFYCCPWCLPALRLLLQSAHHNYLNTSDIITFHYHMPLLHVEMLTILGVLIKFTVLKFLCSGGVRHLQRGRFACPRLGSSVTCCCCCSSTWLPCTGIFTLTLNVNLYLHLCACAWPVAIGTWYPCLSLTRLYNCSLNGSRALGLERQWVLRGGRRNLVRSRVNQLKDGSLSDVWQNP